MEVPGELKIGLIAQPSSILKKNPKYTKERATRFSATNAAVLLANDYGNDDAIPGVRTSKAPPPSRKDLKKLPAPGTRLI